jgi:hypothetical protein
VEEDSEVEEEVESVAVVGEVGTLVDFAKEVVEVAVEIVAEVAQAVVGAAKAAAVAERFGLEVAVDEVAEVAEEDQDIVETEQPGPAAADIPDLGAAQTAAAANLSAVAVVPAPAAVAIVPAPVDHLEAQSSASMQSEHSADFSSSSNSL